MPRKSTKKTNDAVDKKVLTQAFAEMTTLLDDQVAITVAGLVSENLITTDGANRVTMVLQSTAKDCINRIRAVRGV